MVTVYDNFFDEEYFNFVSDYSLDIWRGKKTQFHANHAWWEEGIIGDSTIVLIHVPPESLEREIIEKVAQITPQHDTKEMRVIFHYWMEGSYIPWHWDGRQRNGTTVYLNKEWDEDWQGYLLYKENEEVKAVLPAPNRAVYIDHTGGNVHHCTTPVLRSSYLRATMQIFENYPE